jgi:hypothetical protein
MAKDIFHDTVKKALEKDGRFGVPMGDYTRPLHN